MPKNASTNRQYSGVNILILWGAVIRTRIYRSKLAHLPSGALARRPRSQGRTRHDRRLRDRFVPSNEKRRAAETGEEVQAIPFLKRFIPFSTLTQCEGLPDEIATTVPPPPPGLIEPTVEALIKATGINISHWRRARLLMLRPKTTCRSRRRRPISSISIGIVPRCMNSVMRRGIPRASTATKADHTAPRNTPSRNW